MTNSVEPKISVQQSDFMIEQETRLLTASNHAIGAVVSFTGLCRSEGGTISALELEHYPGMAEAQLLQISKEAIGKFELLGLTAIHRFGKINIGENIVLVIAAAAHRQAAFDGANFVMDYLKTEAPFWKKEHSANGDIGKWISATDNDKSALNKWAD